MLYIFSIIRRTGSVHKRLLGLALFLNLTALPLAVAGEENAVNPADIQQKDQATLVEEDAVNPEDIQQKDQATLVEEDTVDPADIQQKDQATLVEENTVNPADIQQKDQATLVEEDTVDPEDIQQTDQATLVLEDVIVTGSRLRRDSFEQASPMQIISGSLSREAGLFTTTDVLQTVGQANGFQFNNSFNAFVLDNGVGSATIGYRGLRADRTLVLVNGRRLAPAGASDAPSVADISLIPTALIQRIENIFDGASAVYGSDAVAGVSNIILRSDVDGLELQYSGSLPQAGGGVENSIAALFGKTGDNWDIMAAGEYYHRRSLSYQDSRFFNGCNEYRFEDRQGNPLSQRQRQLPGTTDSACRLNTINSAVAGDFSGSLLGDLYATPGTTNIAVPGWSNNVISPFLDIFAPAGTVTSIDTDGDGIPDSPVADSDQNGLVDVDVQSPFYNYDRSARVQQGDLYSGLERFNFYGLGSYNLEDANDTELYFEALYARRRSDVFTPSINSLTALSAEVPASNPFNISNPDGVAAFDNPFLNFGPFPITPTLAVRGDREFTDVQVNQYRLVGGVRGNIGWLDDFLGGQWFYDAYVSHSRAKGTSERAGIHEQRLNLSLSTTIADPANPNRYICGADEDDDGVPDGNDGCVPVNLLSPSLYQEGGGLFASRAEADYLFAVSTFSTTVEQTVVNGHVQGDLFTLPNGSIIPLLLGYEFRRDRVASIPNEIAAEGALYRASRNLGARGARYLHEVFGETSIALLVDKPFAEDLILDLSARLTDEDSFKPHLTYSSKLLYRPLSWLSLRGTYGTSFRAPNPRERFLIGTSGLETLDDPCSVPDTARFSFFGFEFYDESGESRSDLTLDTCRAQDLDPTELELPESSVVESVDRGSSELQPETSTSYTFGVVLEQPFSDAFELVLSASYFSITSRNGIVTPNTNAIIRNCYFNQEFPDATSPFCNRIIRNPDGTISEIDSTFLNAERETAKGIDLDLTYEQDITLGNANINAQLDVNAIYTSQRSTRVLSTSIDRAGQPRTPRWHADANLTLAYKNIHFNWFIRWIQAGQNTPSEFLPDAAPCDGLPVSCRPVYFTTNYAVHNTSLGYEWRNYRLNVGIRNILNQAPPQVDLNGGVFSDRNVPLGIAYDLFGRSFFMNLTAKF